VKPDDTEARKKDLRPGDTLAHIYCDVHTLVGAVDRV